MRFQRLSLAALSAAVKCSGGGRGTMRTTATTTTTTWRPITTTPASLHPAREWWSSSSSSPSSPPHRRQQRERRREYAASASSGSEPPGGGIPPTVQGATAVAPGWGGGGADDELDPDGSTRRALEIAIDRAGLYRAMEAAHGGGGDVDGRPLRGLEAHLASIIKFRGGPITLAEYMQEVLTHPEFGYYMHRDVFGAGGDFITSPEISQVFGELMGIWAMCMWERMGKPAAVCLVELGPGRGTLMADLLRGTARFEAFTAALRVHMVEVSPKLRGIQRETLKCPLATDISDVDSRGSASTHEENHDDVAGGMVSDSNAMGNTLAGIRIAANPMAHVNVDDERGGGGSISSGGGGSGGSGGGGVGGSTPEELGWDPVDRGVSGLNGRPVEWHETLDTVPAGPTILIAHEFFDAMPVHQFTRTERGWCERLVALRGQAPRPATARATGGEGADENPAATPAPAPAPTPAQGPAPTDAAEAETSLEMVLSPGLTPAGALMIPRRLEGMSDDQKQSLRQLEISPRTLAIWERIAVRIEQHGGAAVAIDYGEEGPLGDTLIAIKNHKFCDVLRDPGSADLSAYVDFGAMRRVIETRVPSPGALYGGVECFGPVTQQALLVSLGIGPRLEALVNGCQTQEEADRIIEGCTRLVSGDDAAGEGPGRGCEVTPTSGGGGGEMENKGDAPPPSPPPPPPPGMGIRYKAIAMVSKGMGAPVGFQQ